MAAYGKLNRCIFIASGTSASAFVVDSARPGYYVPNDCMNPPVVDAAPYNYVAFSDDNSVHQEGLGLWDDGTATLTVLTISASSSGGSAVTFATPPNVMMGNSDADATACAPLPVTVTTVPPNLFSKKIAVYSQQGAQSGPNFYTVSGPWVGDTALEEFDFSNVTLTEMTCNIAGVTETLAFSGLASLTDASMPDLEIIFRSLQATSMNQLTTFDFPSLRYIGESLSLGDMDSSLPVQTELSFPTLVEAGTLNIGNGSTLEALDFPAFKYGNINISGMTNAAFTDVEFPEWLVGNFNIASCPNVTTVSIPAWTGPGEVTLSGGGMDALTLVECGGDSAASLLDASSMGALVTLDLSTATRFGNFYIEDNAVLTSLVADNITTLGDAGGNPSTIATCPLLTTVAFPALTAIDTSGGSYLTLNGLAALTSLDLSALVDGGINIGDGNPGTIPLLTTLSLSAFVGDANSFAVVGGLDLLGTADFSVMTAGKLGFSTCPSLTSIDLGGLGNSPDFRIEMTSCDVLTTLDLSTATAIKKINVDTCPLLTSIDLSSLVNLQLGVAIYDLAVLPSFTLPDIEIIGADFEIIGSCPLLVTVSLGSGLLSAGNFAVRTALDEASVDGILVSLAALDGTGGTTSYDNFTVDLTGGNAPPSATGLAAKAVLELRGNTVLVN